MGHGVWRCTSAITVRNNYIGNWWSTYINPTNPGSNLLFEGNHFDNNHVGIGSDGLNDVNIQYNKFTGNDLEGFGTSNVGSNVRAHNNDFVGNAAGINHYGGGQTVDATNNWWGDNSGPLDASDDTGSGGWYNPDGLGDAVSDYVDYDPWTTQSVANDMGWYEQFDVSNNINSVRAGHWVYQTFTPSVTHYFNAVSLNLYKTSSLTNYTVTIGLYSVDADHKPVTMLRSTSFGAASLTQTATWRDYSFSTYEVDNGYEVVAGTEYAIVLSGNGGNTGSFVAVALNMSGGYSGGLEGKSTDGGTTWVVFDPSHGSELAAEGWFGWCEKFEVSNNINSVRAGHWVYQTFTPSATHYFNRVSLNLYRLGATNYTVTIGLYSVDADHKPVALLCSTAFAASVLTTTPTWRTYGFSTGYEVAAGTEYAIVLSGSGGDTGNFVAVALNMSGGYSGGLEGKSTDGGTTWVVFDPSTDLNFREGWWL